VTRRDFRALAGILDAVQHDPNADATTVHILGHLIADLCAKVNPTFDRRKFLDAAGMNGGID
jgi:hypothetical protein